MVEPFYFGLPTFEWPAILTMILVAMVSLVESTGVYFALGDICERDIKKKDLEKVYRAEGIAVLLGGIFNAFPYTTFSQNVGLIQMSGVRSRKVILIAGIMLITLGFVPKNCSYNNNNSCSCFRRRNGRNVRYGRVPRN